MGHNTRVGIIFASNFSYAMIVANLLEEYLAEFSDVTVGLTSIMEPATMLDIQPEILIIGGIAHDGVPDPELTSWLEELSHLFTSKHQTIVKFAIYSIGAPSIFYESEWQRFITENFPSARFNSQILFIWVDQQRLSLGRQQISKIKNFSSNIIRDFESKLSQNQYGK